MPQLRASVCEILVILSARREDKHVILKTHRCQDAAEQATEEPPDGAPSNNRSRARAIAEKACSKAAAPAARRARDPRRRRPPASPPRRRRPRLFPRRRASRVVASGPAAGARRRQCVDATASAKDAPRATPSSRSPLSPTLPATRTSPITETRLPRAAGATAPPGPCHHNFGAPSSRNAAAAAIV